MLIVDAAQWLFAAERGLSPCRSDRYNSTIARALAAARPILQRERGLT